MRACSSLLLPLVCCALLAGCFFSPDPPLLTTPLPNGYAFHSNGGEVGYIAPAGGSRHPAFGITDDGEYWCREFGWSGPMVVCRYLREGGNRSHDKGFFVFDTSNGRHVVVPDEAAALAVLRSRGVMAMPDLRQRYFFRTSRR